MKRLISNIKPQNVQNHLAFRPLLQNC